MGKSAVDYNLNGLDFKKFEEIYNSKEVIEASQEAYFKNKPSFNQVKNVLEFDNETIQFIFKETPIIESDWLVITQ